MRPRIVEHVLFVELATILRVLVRQKRLLEMDPTEVDQQSERASRARAPVERERIRG